MSKKAVQFGAGNIGRGFLGQLYFESGYETTFIDIDKTIVNGLNSRREYPLCIVGDELNMLTIHDVSAVKASDLDAVGRALAEADLAATAVGVPVLPKVAPMLASGIARRFQMADARPLNLIVCENMIDAGPYLRDEVRRHLAPEYHAVLEEKVGFVEASIGRMVPIMTTEQRAADPLLICVEPYCDLPVDANGFKGPIPYLEHMQPRGNFGAYVERKLFVHNAGHAATAYLGYLRGHEYIWQAIQDSAVRDEADAAMAETRAALVAKHGLDAGELEAHWHDLVRRFQNKGLGDQVARVAKDPLRKLGPNDRLIGAARMCLAQGVAPAHVAFAAAAAIRYDHPDDPAARALQEVVRDHGVEGVLARICQIAEDSPLGLLIRRQFERLAQQGWAT